MSLPRVVAVAPGSPAQRAGLEPGHEVVTLNGHQPRDVIQWQLLADEADLDVEVRRGGLDLDLSVAKGAGEPLGAEVHSALLVLEDTVAGVLDSYSGLATLCVVPLGLSRYSREGSLRVHTADEAAAVIDAVEEWQRIFLSALGRRLVFAADEYYLLAGRPFPS